MTIKEKIEAARQQDLLTVTQFALLAHYNPQTVYRKIDAGEIPGVVRHGRTIRLHRVTALAWHRTDRDAADARR